MKKKIMVIAILASGGLAVFQCTNKDEVPLAVKESFKKLYPEAKVDEWEIDEGNYEAEFKKGTEEWEIEFDAKGNLIKSEMELASMEEFPGPVQMTLNKDFSGIEPQEPEKIILPDGKVVYETEVKMDDKKYELQFDEAGMLLAKIEDIESK